MDIPIENIFYILCYAWDFLSEGKAIYTADIKETKLVNFFARVFNSALQQLISKGFFKYYRTYSESSNLVRGKIIFAESIKNNSLKNAKLFCEMDEYDQNNVHNQIIKATLIDLINKLDYTTNKEATIKLAEELYSLVNLFSEVDLITLRKQDFQRAWINRNNRPYMLLLKICELIYDHSLPTQNDGSNIFMEFIDTDKKMNMVFQNFVYNFFVIEQKQYKVFRERMKWRMTSVNESHLRHLPTMNTDISLLSKEKKIIIDTKYSKNIFNTTTLSNFEKIKSPDLYQLFSYVKQGESDDIKSLCSTGILLYPAQGEKIDLRYEFDKHQLRIGTINLDQPWINIHQDLLSLIS